MKVVLQDIVRQVSKSTKLTLPDAQVVVRKLISTLETGLVKGQKIEIRDFGVFQVKTVSGKKGRDLNRGVSIDLPPYQKVSFKVGKNLKKLFQNLPDETKPQEAKDQPLDGTPGGPADQAQGKPLDQAQGQLEMSVLMEEIAVR
jgi:nucleoid DNA-binding protein